MLRYVRASYTCKEKFNPGLDSVFDSPMLCGTSEFEFRFWRRTLFSRPVPSLTDHQAFKCLRVCTPCTSSQLRPRLKSLCPHEQFGLHICRSLRDGCEQKALTSAADDDCIMMINDLIPDTMEMTWLLGAKSSISRIRSRKTQNPIYFVVSSVSSSHPQNLLAFCPAKAEPGKLTSLLGSSKTLWLLGLPTHQQHCSPKSLQCCALSISTMVPGTLLICDLLWQSYCPLHWQH